MVWIQAHAHVLMTILANWTLFLLRPQSNIVLKKRRRESGIIKRSLGSALGHLVVHLASRIRINYILTGYLSSAAWQQSIHQRSWVTEVKTRSLFSIWLGFFSYWAKRPAKVLLCVGHERREMDIGMSLSVIETIRHAEPEWMLTASAASKDGSTLWSAHVISDGCQCLCC